MLNNTLAASAVPLVTPVLFYRTAAAVSVLLPVLLPGCCVVLRGAA